jgi:hypothetical protein
MLMDHPGENAAAAFGIEAAGEDEVAHGNF